MSVARARTRTRYAAPIHLLQQDQNVIERPVAVTNKLAGHELALRTLVGSEAPESRKSRGCAQQ